MDRHTPGPWTIDRSMRTAINKGLKHIAMGNFYHSGDNRKDILAEEHKANVNLIAAAPELLETLETLVCCPAFNGLLFDADLESHKAWTLARAAIDKARGRQ